MNYWWAPRKIWTAASRYQRRRRARRPRSFDRANRVGCGGVRVLFCPHEARTNSRIEHRWHRALRYVRYVPLCQMESFFGVISRELFETPRRSRPFFLYFPSSSEDDLHRCACVGFGEELLAPSNSNIIVTKRWWWDL